MEVIAKVRAIIVDTQEMGYEMIVGRDFLDQACVMLVKSHNRVTIWELPRTRETNKNIVGIYPVESVSEGGEIVFGNVDYESKKLCKALINSYSDRISTSIRTLGKTSTVEMDIRCMPDSPIVYNPYRMAETERMAARRIIDELLDNDIVRESESSYASPIILVKKRRIITDCVWTIADSPR